MICNQQFVTAEEVKGCYFSLWRCQQKGITFLSCLKSTWSSARRWQAKDKRCPSLLDPTYFPPWTPSTKYISLVTRKMPPSSRVSWRRSAAPHKWEGIWRVKKILKRKSNSYKPVQLEDTKKTCTCNQFENQFKSENNLEVHMEKVLKEKVSHFKFNQCNSVFENRKGICTKCHCLQFHK